MTRMGTNLPTAADDDRAHDVLASDGERVTIRPAVAGDLEALAVLRKGSPCAATGLTMIALENAHLIGAASGLRVRPDGASAEVEVVIANRHRRRGLGTLLVEGLAAHARDQGVTRLLGGSSRPLPELPGVPTPHIDDGPLLADRSALRRVLAPRSVAVVGAGRRHGSAGRETLHALLDYGFRGRLYAVNRSGRPVCGVPACRTVAELPEAIDLLVIAVPADQVARVLTDAGRVGARGAVLLGTGLRTGDPVGDRHRRDVLRVAREHGIRLLGPSCLGILNTDPRVRLNASLAPARPPHGGLAVAVRSGAVGVALLADAVRDHCGISSFVSLGDQLDVTGSDLLAHWFDDPATRAVALSPESFGEPGRFARAARALGRRKPVLVIAGSPPDAGDDLLDRAGVIRTASLGETLDTARMLVDQPLPAGGRMAIVGNASGLTVLAADAARSYGFDVVPLSGSTRAELPYVSGAGRCDNPVDLGVDALPARIAEAAETVAHSGEADILLLVLVGIRANVLAANMAALAEVLDDHPDLTVAVIVTGGTAETHRLGRRGAPVFREPEHAVRALAHALDYAAWRREPLDRLPRLDDVQPTTRQTSVRPTLAAGPGWLERQEPAEFLEAYGIGGLSAALTRPAATPR